MMRNPKYYLILFLVVFASGCTAGSSASDTLVNEANASNALPPAETDAANPDIQAAMQAAAAYLKTQYSVDLNNQTQSQKQQLEQLHQQLQPLLTGEYYIWANKHHILDIPLKIALHEKSSIIPKEMTIRSRTTSHTDAFIRLSYRLDFYLEAHDKSAPLGGKLIMQQVNGTWKVSSDYNNIESLLEWHGIPASS